MSSLKDKEVKRVKSKEMLTKEMSNTTFKIDPWAEDTFSASDITTFSNVNTGTSIPTWGTGTYPGYTNPPIQIQPPTNPPVQTTTQSHADIAVRLAAMEKEISHLKETIDDLKLFIHELFIEAHKKD